MRFRYRLDWLLLAAVILYFFAMAGSGLRAGISHDDLMNTHGAASVPLSSVVAANVKFWSTFYRPFGSLFYAAFFRWFGFDPLPYRIAVYAVATANLVLLYLIVRRLTASAYVAGIAALIFAYHSNLFSVYYNTGQVYDVLCCFFSYAAMLVYIQARKRGRLRARELVAIALLFILAINSKEIGAALPLVIFAYEALYHPRTLRDWRAWAPALTVLGLLAGIYALGKVYGANSLTAHPAYHPRLSLGAYLDSIGVLVNDLTYRSGPFARDLAVVTLVSATVLAMTLRSRTMGFALALLMLSGLPVALIAPRGLSAYYLPYGGVGIYVAGVAEAVAAKLPQKLRDALLAIAFGLLLYWSPLYHGEHAPAIASMKAESDVVEAYARDVEPLCASFAPRERILVRSDPFGEMNWASTFTIRLACRNYTLRITRSGAGPARPDPPEGYGHVLAWDGAHIVVERR